MTAFWPLAAAAQAPPVTEPSPAPAPVLSPAGEAFLKRFAGVRFFGGGALNWRNVGPKEPGFETQIQDQVYLSELYLGAEIPAHEKTPFFIEWTMPTSKQGAVELNQMFVEYNGQRRLKLQGGKFLVPFGRYNELYRADQYLAVTRPLLYASPDGLDLVVRPNSPRPPVSNGYADVGARLSWYPVVVHPLVPVELTAFVVNGIGESKNRLRTFPNPQNLGIPGPSTNGVQPDFGHANNNLADNNNAKSGGGRIVFALGDLRLPWPFPERSADDSGVLLGLSGMGGQYDLEGQLNYHLLSADFSFEYKGVGLSGEFMYSRNQFLAPLMVSSTTASNATLRSPIQQSRQAEQIYGYFVQAVFPLLRAPPVGERVAGVLVFNRLYRRGPLLDFLLNYNDGSNTFESLVAYRPEAPFVTRHIDKYTAGVHWKLSRRFAAKFDYSYWVMGKSTVRSPTSLGLNDIYQGALSLVVGF
ncbi:MAG: hypothetical protein SF051_16465 [Elusimicrobiota bacterium]|nr:hypothetical protein [Elusimicrobiota bacterium]